MFLSFFILIGFIWYIVDAFLIPGMIRERQDALRQRLGAELSFDLAQSGVPVVRR